MSPRKFRSVRSPALGAAKMGHRQWAILETLSRQPQVGRTAREVATEQRANHSSVATCLLRLETRGLVRSVGKEPRSIDHRNVWIWEITAQGMYAVQTQGVRVPA